jgi:hypothetical protein
MLRIATLSTLIGCALASPTLQADPACLMAADVRRALAGHGEAATREFCRSERAADRATARWPSPARAAQEERERWQLVLFDDQKARNRTRLSLGRKGLLLKVAL